jgi:hypothetical protein
MKKYDIIEDREELEQNIIWQSGRTAHCVKRIDEFLEEWQTEFGRKPVLQSCIAGIEFFEYLSKSGFSKIVDGNEIWLTLYGVVIEVYRDWSVHPLYIELNLQ